MQLNGLILATVIFVILKAVFMTYAMVNFQGIECIALDPTFAEFEYCFMKSLNQSHKYFSFKVIVHKKPISNVTVNGSLKKKENVFKPFLYNLTFDGCAFLERRRHALVNFLYGYLERYSNINHSCPFNHDLIVEKLNLYDVNKDITKMLPMLPGKYGLFTTWSVFDKPRASVNFFTQISY